MKRNGRGGRAAPNGYKILSIFLAAVLLIAAITELVLWQMDYIVFQNPNKTEEQTEEDVGSGMVVTPSGEGTFLSLNVSTLSEETAAAENEEESDIKTLTVEFNPTIATDKRVTWSIGFANPSSAWASGKDANDYVMLTPEENNGPSATLECKQAFGEQIIVTVTSMDNAGATDTATVDYARRILDTAYFLKDSMDSTVTHGKIDFSTTDYYIDFTYPDTSNGSPTNGYNGQVWAYLPYINAGSFSGLTSDENLTDTVQFSDYTIQDTAFNDNGIWQNINGIVTLNGTIRSAISTHLTNAGAPVMSISLSKIANNPLAFMMESEINVNNIMPYWGQFFNSFMPWLVNWLQENPDEPVFTITHTVEMQYSTYTRIINVYYNPETVNVPVWAVSIDEESVVM